MFLAYMRQSKYTNFNCKYSIPRTVHFLKFPLFLLFLFNQTDQTILNTQNDTLLQTNFQVQFIILKFILARCVFFTEYILFVVIFLITLLEFLSCPFLQIPKVTLFIRFITAQYSEILSIQLGQSIDRLCRLHS